MTALADIPAAQIVHYSPETVAKWLLARNEQHRVRLRAALQKLRDASDLRARALDNLQPIVLAAGETVR